MITYGSQYIFKNDFAILKKALSSKKISQGKYCESFEKKLKKFLKVKHTCLTNSGTSAIQLAFESLNLKKGSIVIMPAITFVATLSIAKKLGFKIYLADINFETGQITAKTILDCILKNKIKPDLIITMYMGGYVFDIDNIYNLKKKYKCFIIEDACHAFGSEYYNKKTKRKSKIGSCKYADISTFSFHPLKTITTGEGGFLSTNNHRIAKNAKLLSSHGIIRNKKDHTKYKINNFGYNFRMSDINAALGISQLKNIYKILDYRKKIYKNYTEKLKNVSFIRNKDPNISSYHLFIVRVNNKRNILDIMKKNKIFCQYHYIPLYKFSAFGKNDKKLYNSEKYYKKSISLPIHLGITSKEQSKVIKLINKFAKN